MKIIQDVQERRLTDHLGDLDTFEEIMTRSMNEFREQLKDQTAQNITLREFSKRTSQYVTQGGIQKSSANGVYRIRSGVRYRDNLNFHGIVGEKRENRDTAFASCSPHLF